MKQLQILIFIIFPFAAFAQIDTIQEKPKPPNLRHKLPKPPKEKPYLELINLIEEMPRFPGCQDIEGDNAGKKSCSDKNMLAFIYANICYLDSARENGIEGTVVISFNIEKDGSITNPIIRRAIGGGCEEEVLRLIKMFPKFIPAELNGKKVRTQFNLPIRFRLE